MEKMENLFRARHLAIVLAPVENGVINLDKNKVINLYGYYDYDLNAYTFFNRVKEAIAKEMGAKNDVEVRENYFRSTHIVYIDGKEYTMTLFNNLYIDRGSEGYYYLTGCSNVNIADVTQPEKYSERTTYLRIAEISEHEDECENNKRMIAESKEMKRITYETGVVRGVRPEVAEPLGLNPTADKTVIIEGRVEVMCADGEVAVIETKKYYWENMSFYFGEAKDWSEENIEITLVKLSPDELYKKLNLN